MDGQALDILYQAASVWNELTEYSYVLTYGYKKQLYTVNLTFSLEDFPHLAGFQYLRDLSLPRYNPRKTVDRILNHKITFEQITKGEQYENLVKPRLEALTRLKDIIEKDFSFFSYMPRMLSIYHNDKSGLSDIEPSGYNEFCVYYQSWF